MSRPFIYDIIDTYEHYDGRVRQTIAHHKMYGIKHGDYWVGQCITNEFTTPIQRKYHKMFYASKRSAQTQCDKLNKKYNSIEYRVVELDGQEW